MITEDFVSFEIARLLKEKGFNIRCQKAYWLDGSICNQAFSNAKEIAAYSRPTLQMAMKWLREVHNIFIAINIILDTAQKHYFFKLYVGEKIYNFPLDYSVEFYSIYEEACEAAIKYCLKNLI